MGAAITGIYTFFVLYMFFFFFHKSSSPFALLQSGERAEQQAELYVWLERPNKKHYAGKECFLGDLIAEVPARETQPPILFFTW